MDNLHFFSVSHDIYLFFSAIQNVNDDDDDYGINFTINWTRIE